MQGLYSANARPFVSRWAHHVEQLAVHTGRVGACPQLLHSCQDGVWAAVLLQDQQSKRQEVRHGILNDHEPASALASTLQGVEEKVSLRLRKDISKELIFSASYTCQMVFAYSRD